MKKIKNKIYSIIIVFIILSSGFAYAKTGDTYDCSVENHIRHYYSSYTKQGSGPEDRYLFDFSFLRGEESLKFLPGEGANYFSSIAYNYTENFEKERFKAKSMGDGLLAYDTGIFTFTFNDYEYTVMIIAKCKVPWSMQVSVTPNHAVLKTILILKQCAGLNEDVCTRTLARYVILCQKVYNC